MKAIIYQFTVKPNRDQDFINYWKIMTEYIYEFEGSLGSRLHKMTEQIYVAYALWPDQNTWLDSGKNPPPKALEIRSHMRDCCEAIEKRYELEVVEDLLK